MNPFDFPMLDDDLAGGWHGRDNFTLALYGLLYRRCGWRSSSDLLLNRLSRRGS